MAWRSSGVVAERVRAAALEGGRRTRGGVGARTSPPRAASPREPGLAPWRAARARALLDQ